MSLLWYKGPGGGWGQQHQVLLPALLASPRACLVTVQAAAGLQSWAPLHLKLGAISVKFLPVHPPGSASTREQE